MTVPAICAVCGYPALDAPPRDENGHASFEICSCCGTQFGYDDASRSHAELRGEWVAAGCRWWSTAEAPPAGWNPDQQLRQAGFQD